MVAVTHDASTSGGSFGNGNTLSWNHTVGSLTNGILVVSIQLSNTAATVSAITYNSVSMTLWDSITTTNGLVYIYYLLNPASGTHSVSITLSGSSWGGAGAVSASNAAQSGTILGGKQTLTQATSASSTVTVSADTNKLVLSACASDMGGSSATMSFTGGETAIDNVQDSLTESGTFTRAAGGASVTMTTTASRNQNHWAQIGFYIAEFVPVPIKALAALGVG